MLAFGRKSQVLVVSLSFAALANACGGRTSLGTGLRADSGGAPAVGGSGGATAGGGGAFAAGGLWGTGGGSIVPGGGGGSEMVLACVPGERIALLGEPARAECQPCASGTFSTTYSATVCEPWTECAWEQREVAMPSSSQDRTCAYDYPIRQFGTTLDDYAHDVAVDDEGFVFVTGTTFGSLDAPPAGDADVFVRKYRPSGDLEWGNVIPSSYFDSVGHLVLGYGSLPYVLVNRWSPAAADTTIWTVQADSAYALGLFAEGGSDLVLDTDASIVLSRNLTEPAGIAHTELRKLDPEGATTWTSLLISDDLVFTSDIELLAGGELVVSGSTNGSLFHPNPGLLQEAFVARVSAEGELLWGVQVAGAARSQLSAVAADSFGNFYAVGASAATYDAESDGFAVRVSPDGVLEWFAQYGPSDSTDELVDIAIDDQDRILVAGRTYGALGPVNHGSEDAVVLRLLPTGELGAVHQFGTAQYEWAEALAIAPDGAVFVVGGSAGSLGDAGNSGGIDAFVYRIPAETF